MPLNLHPDVHASGSVPAGWVPVKGGTIKYRVNNAALLTYLRSLLPGNWQKVIKKGPRGTSIISSMLLDKLPTSSVIHDETVRMNKKVDFGELFSKAEGSPGGVLDLFAILNLGLVEALANGLLDPEDAVRFFYHSDNCLYVKKHVKSRPANEVMGFGVQLPDLFDALPPGQAHRELLREIAAMRELCLKMLAEHRSVA